MSRNTSPFVLLVALVAVLCSLALAQCPPGVVCPTPQPQWTYPAQQPTFRQPPADPASVIVRCADGSVGSGTVIDGAPAGSAYVLTAQHVIRDSPTPEVSVLVGQDSYRAQVIDQDAENDVAILLVPQPLVSVPIATEIVQRGTYTSRGFAGGTLYQIRRGSVVTRTTRPEGFVGGWAVVPGESGGGVYDAQGRVCGVVYGRGSDGCYFTGPGPIVRLLDRVRARLNPPRVLTPVVPVYPIQPLPPTQEAPAGPSAPGGQEAPAVPTPATPTDPLVECARGCIQWQAATERDIAGLTTRLDSIDGRLTQIDARFISIETTIATNSSGWQGPLAELSKRVDALSVQAPTTATEKHYVLVADTGASYWTRMQAEYAKAKEGHSGIRLAAPPSYPVGPLPRLVAYQDGKPTGDAAGARDVSDALWRLSQGRNPQL